MCGICGVYDTKMKHIPRSTVMNMCQAMVHRGPDDFGFWSRDSIILGHRRLSIIDLETGQQPIVNENGTIALVVNGEIYNYGELREALVEKGHRFSSNSDSEVIVHLYEEYGEKCLSRLRGMFAFALWDDARHRLFCGRDRVGKKPFFYHFAQYKGANQFRFASELSALMTEPGIDRHIDKRALYYYLTYGYVPAPMTIYSQVKKLPPAHYLIVDDRGLTITRYWSHERAPSQPQGNPVKTVRALVTDATRLRMVSDVPLGAFLSGGLDSSTIVAVMAGLQKQAVKTFTVGFDDAEYDERSFARLIAARYKTQHEETVVTPDVAKILPLLMRHVGEPFADASCIPTYYVAQHARQFVKVALSGDGADELFAGYERYQATRLSRVVSPLLRIVPDAALKYVLDRIPSGTDLRSKSDRMRRFIEGSRLTLTKRYKRWMSYFPENELDALTGGEIGAFVKEERLVDGILKLFDTTKRTDIVDVLMHVDMESYLPGDLLVKMDSASMANSLEVRSPFLDHKLIEYVWSLDRSLKLRGNTTKYVLRKAFGSLVPREIVARSKKGFGVPVAAWLRGSLRTYAYDTLLSPQSFAASHLNVGFIRTMLDQHMAGTWNYSKQVWALLALETWYSSCYRKM